MNKQSIKSALIVYLLVNSFFILGGFIGKAVTKERGCNSMLRMEYVFPGFQIGCYLGEVPK